MMYQNIFLVSGEKSRKTTKKIKTKMRTKIINSTKLISPFWKEGQIKD